jgi:TolA-binding protein
MDRKTPYSKSVSVSVSAAFSLDPRRSNVCRHSSSVLLGAALFLVSCISAVAPSVALAQGIQMTSEFQQSRQELAQGNFEAAVSLLSGLLGDSRTAAGAKVEIGNIRLRQAEMEMSQALGHFADAAANLSQGLEGGGLTGPEMPKVMYDLGRIYEERLSDYPKAAQMFETVVREHPNFLALDKVIFHWASCLEKLGKNEEAAAAYQQLLGNHPYSSFAQVAQGRMRALAPGTGQAGAAIEMQERLIDEAKSETQSAKASMDLATMHVKSGDYKKAIEAYRTAIREAGDSDLGREAAKRMATLMDEKDKDYKGAAGVLEDLVQKYPDDPDNDQNLYRLGRIYEQNMTDLKTRVVDGQVRYRRGTENAAKAIEYYDSVTNNYPDADVSADAFLRKGELYEKTVKDSDRARQEYGEFLKRFPMHSQADTIRQRLRSLED